MAISDPHPGTAMQAMPTDHRKFESLDALRGVAALIVVTYHVHPLFGGRLFEHAYLSVDLFFMLSGFVLAFAYQSRLDQGLTTASFLKLRLVRLYPLYFIGLLLGAVYLLLQSHLQHQTAELMTSPLILLPAIFFVPLPAFVVGAGQLAFPFNLATWSLFSELVANFLHALLLRKRNTRTLLACLFVAGAVLCVSTIHRGSMNFGVKGDDISFGLERVFFSYLAGLILYRLWRKIPRRSVWTGLPILLLSFVLGIPEFAHGSALFDLSMAMLVFPFIILMGASSEPLPGFRRISRILGTASYAIYVLHVPLERYFTSAWKVLTRQWPDHSAPWPGVLFVVLVICFALGMDAVYDIPARRWLRTYLRI